MLTFKELIVITDFTKVWEKFIIHYPKKKDRIEKFCTLYKNLKLPYKDRDHIFSSWSIHKDYPEWILDVYLYKCFPGEN